MAAEARKPLYPRLPDTLCLSSDNDEEDFPAEEGAGVTPAQPRHRAAAPAGCPGGGRATAAECNSSSSPGDQLGGEAGRSSRRREPGAAGASVVPGTLSLADFEVKYLNRRHQHHRSPKRSHSSVARGHQLGVLDVGSILSSMQATAVWCFHWIGGASHWKIVLVGGLLGVLLAALLGSGESGLKENPQGTPCWHWGWGLPLTE